MSYYYDYDKKYSQCYPCGEGYFDKQQFDCDEKKDYCKNDQYGCCKKWCCCYEQKCYKPYPKPRPKPCCIPFCGCLFFKCPPKW